MFYSRAVNNALRSQRKHIPNYSVWLCMLLVEVAAPGEKFSFAGRGRFLKHSGQNVTNIILFVHRLKQTWF